jgi:hypothetical protein
LIEGWCLLFVYLSEMVPLMGRTVMKSFRLIF